MKTTETIKVWLNRWCVATSISWYNDQLYKNKVFDGIHICIQSHSQIYAHSYISIAHSKCFYVVDLNSSSCYYPQFSIYTWTTDQTFKFFKRTLATLFLLTQGHLSFKTLRPRRNVRRFSNAFLMKIYAFMITISLMFVPKRPINNIPLSEPVIAHFTDAYMRHTASVG